MFLVQDGNLLFLSPQKQIQEFNFMMSKSDIIAKQVELKAIEIQTNVNTISVNKKIEIVTITKQDEI